MNALYRCYNNITDNAGLFLVYVLAHLSWRLKWYSWNSRYYILLLVKKQSGSGSAGFTRNQLIWLHTVFKWYSWNSKCYILLLVKYSLDPDQLASPEISSSDFILFSNNTLEIVDIISYSWWKNSLDLDQLASPEISVSDFILFSNDTLEIINVISYSWWKNSLDPDQLTSPEISLSDFILFSNDALEIVYVISYSWWKTVWTQISWLPQKSAYLTSYCFQMMLLK